LLNLPREELNAKSLEELLPLINSSLAFKVERDEQIHFIIDTLNDAMEQCTPTLNDLEQPDSSRSTPNSRVNLIEELRKYIPILANHNRQQQQNPLKIIPYFIDGCTILSRKMAPIKALLLNLVKNANDVGASEISIKVYRPNFVSSDKHSTSLKEDTSQSTIMIDVCDNGPGMPEWLIKNFFERPLLKKSSSFFADVEAKRGEGSLLAYDLFKRAGGSCFLSSNSDGRGVTFNLSMSVPTNDLISHYPGTPKPVKFNSPIEDYFQDLANLPSKCPKGVILLQQF
jgi:K+-sensing histidine kinase KdpD